MFYWLKVFEQNYSKWILLMNSSLLQTYSVHETIIKMHLAYNTNMNKIKKKWNSTLQLLRWLIKYYDTNPKVSGIWNSHENGFFHWILHVHRVVRFWLISPFTCYANFLSTPERLAYAWQLKKKKNCLFNQKPSYCEM